MDRTRVLALMGAVSAVVGVIGVSRWPSSEPALDCDPTAVRWREGARGLVARCEPDGPPSDVPAAQGLTVGIKLDLNRASVDDLKLLSGVGPALAKALIRAREERGGFTSWDEVDQVPGVGAAKLEVLQRSASIRNPPSMDGKVGSARLSEREADPR